MKRNDGIDLLRITATIMICVYHVLGVGGVMQGTEYLSGHWAAAWGLEKLMLGCVNCYGLISGYVNVDVKYKPSRWLNQWLQVMFYSVGIMLVFHLLHPGLIAPQEIVPYLFPTLTSKYWYFSSYTGLFLLMPVLNHVINTMDSRVLGRTLLIAVSVFGISVLTTHDALVLHNGYSALWLMLLYLCGGWIRRHGSNRRSARFWGCVFLLSSAGMLGLKLVSDYAFLHHDFRILEKLYSAFGSPAVLLSAVALLKIFANLRIERTWMKKIISFITPACFGVYLIHVHPCVWSHVLNGAFRWIAAYPIIPMLLLTLGVSVGIFIICTAIDTLRIRLFRLMRVPRLTESVCMWFQQRFFPSANT